MSHLFPAAAEIPELRSRQRRCLSVSLLLHALLFCWLILVPRDEAEPLGIVEISWLEPEPAAAAVAAPPARRDPKPEPAVVATAAARPPVRFRREDDEADVEPRPQSPAARQDRLDERLASLRRLETRSPALAAAAEAPSRWSKVAAASAPNALGMASASAPQDLARGAQPAGEPLALHREPTRGRAPALAAAPPAPPTHEAAPAAGATTTASRTLAGVTLSGAVADRPVLTHALPDYPAWAMQEAVEATVTLLFVVLPDGRVKENVQLQKTAGYSDFDDNAVAALLRWRFQALPAGETEEQWGTITFRYRLRDTR